MPIPSLTPPNPTYVRTQLYSSAFMETLEKSFVLWGLADRRFEGPMQNAASMQIPKWTEALDVQSLSLGATDYSSTVDDASVSSEVISWGTKFQTGAKIPVEDVADLTPNTIMEYSYQRGLRVANYLDTLLATTMNTFNLGAVQNDFRNSATSSHTSTIGVANAYLSPTTGRTVYASGASAAEKAAFTEDVVYDTLEGYMLTLMNNNQWGAAAMNGGRRWYAIINPSMWMNLQRTIAGKSGDVLTVDFIDGRYRRTLFGVFEIIVSNNLGEVSLSSKKHRSLYVISDGFAVVGMRNSIMAYFSPQVNQSGPYHEFRASAQQFNKIFDDRMMYRTYIRAET